MLFMLLMLLLLLLLLLLGLVGCALPCRVALCLTLPFLLLCAGASQKADNWVIHSTAAPKDASGAGKSAGLDLLGCIEAFGVPEVLSEMDEWYCGKCKNHVRATKEMTIWSYPKYLCVHLKVP